MKNDSRLPVFGLTQQRLKHMRSVSVAADSARAPFGSAKRRSVLVIREVRLPYPVASASLVATMGLSCLGDGHVFPGDAAIT